MTKTIEEKKLIKLDRIINLLESLLIIQGKMIPISNEALRKIAGVGTARVTELVQSIKVPKDQKR